MRVVVVCWLYVFVCSAVSPFVCLRIFLCCVSYWLRVRDLFFDVRLFCFVGSGGLNILHNQSSRFIKIVPILFCSCALFLFVVVSALMLFDTKKPTF